MSRETLVFIRGKDGRPGRFVTKVRNGLYTAAYLRHLKTANAVAQGSGIMVISDLEPYRSPIDGTVVTSRSAHRDHMRRHDVVELGTQPVTRKNPAKMSRAGPSIKEAIERLRSGQGD